MRRDFGIGERKSEDFHVSFVEGRPSLAIWTGVQDEQRSHHCRLRFGGYDVTRGVPDDFLRALYHFRSPHIVQRNRVTSTTELCFLTFAKIWDEPQALRKSHTPHP